LLTLIKRTVFSISAGPFDITPCVIYLLILTTGYKPNLGFLEHVKLMFLNSQIEI